MSRRVISRIIEITLTVLLIQLAAALDCEIQVDTYVCKIPIKMDVEIQETGWSLELKEQTITSEAGEAKVNLIFKNNKDTSIVVDYYSYAYQGNRCLSCEDNRNESLRSIKLDPRSVENIQVTLKGNFSNESKFKIRYKEESRKTWKERKGAIVIKLNEKMQKEIFIQKEITKSKSEAIDKILSLDNYSNAENTITQIDSKIELKSNSSKVKVILNTIIILGIAGIGIMSTIYNRKKHF